MHCSISSLQHPAHLFRTTQEGIKMCSTSSGYSCRISTSSSRGWHKLLLYTSIRGITVRKKEKKKKEGQRVTKQQRNTLKQRFDLNIGRRARDSERRRVNRHVHPHFRAYCSIQKLFVYVSKKSGLLLLTLTQFLTDINLRSFVSHSSCAKVFQLWCIIIHLVCGCTITASRMGLFTFSLPPHAYTHLCLCRSSALEKDVSTQSDNTSETSPRPRVSLKPTQHAGPLERQSKHAWAISWTSAWLSKLDWATPGLCKMNLWANEVTFLSLKEWWWPPPPSLTSSGTQVSEVKLHLLNNKKSKGVQSLHSEATKHPPGGDHFLLERLSFPLWTHARERLYSLFPRCPVGHLPSCGPLAASFGMWALCKRKPVLINNSKKKKKNVIVINMLFSYPIVQTIMFAFKHFYWRPISLYPHDEEPQEETVIYKNPYLTENDLPNVYGLVS